MKNISVVCVFLSAFFFAACSDDSNSISRPDENISSVALSSLSSTSDGKESNSSVKSSSSEKDSLSSKKAESSSSVPEILVDSRNGQKYKTVVIGKQTWMAENLKIPSSDAFCFDDDDASKYKRGCLYLWQTAMDGDGIRSSNGKGCGYNKTCSPTYPVRGICPENWHLPTKAEFETLFAALDDSSTAGLKLKSTGGWFSNGNGTDSFSFSAYPAGFMFKKEAYFDSNIDLEEDKSAYFWSSTEIDRVVAYNMSLLYNSDTVGMTRCDKEIRLSVRCVKDEGVASKYSSSSVSLSSSSLKSSSSVEPAVLPSEIVKGTMTDERDSRNYKTVVIGSQTWMAQNLNYKTANSFCYSEQKNYCSMYGQMYKWADAMKACPSGWHLPTETEWRTLFTAVGGDRVAGLVLKSSVGWNSNGNGTDAYSFSAVPGGNRGHYGGYAAEGFGASYWSSTENSTTGAYFVSLYYKDDDAVLEVNTKQCGYSVRCVKD